MKAAEKKRVPDKGRKKDIKKPLLISLGLLAALTVLVVYGLMYMKGNGWSTRAPKEATAFNITPQEVDLTVNLRDGSKLNITGEDVRFRIGFGDSVGEKESLLESTRLFAGQEQFIFPELGYIYDEDALEAKIREVTGKTPEEEDKPRDAYITCDSDGNMSIVPEHNGNTVNHEVLLIAIRNALINNESSIELASVPGAYAEPDVRADDEEIIARLADLNSFLALEESFKLTNGEVVLLGRDTLREWIDHSEETGAYFLSDSTLKDRCAEYIASLAEQDDYYSKTVKFKTTNYGVMDVQAKQSHGHHLDQPAMADALFEALKARQSTHHELIYADDDSIPTDLGGTYVEIDIRKQIVYMYEDNVCTLKGSCVTGLAYDPERLTPSGYYTVYMKDKDRTLKGQIDPATGKPSYESFVNYICFFYMGYGIHDASWRGGRFGENIYQYGGSHGCVNMSYNDAKYIYDHVKVGTPVVVVRDIELQAEEDAKIEAFVEKKKAEEEAKKKKEQEKKNTPTPKPTTAPTPAPTKAPTPVPATPTTAPETPPEQPAE